MQDRSGEERDDKTTDGERKYGKVNSRTLGFRMKKHTAESLSNNVLSQATVELLCKARGSGVSTGFLLETPHVACGVHGRPREHSLLLSQQNFSAVYRQLVGALEAYARRKNGRFTLEVNEVHMLFYSIINCRTLREAILRTAEFVAMLDRPMCAELNIHGDIAEFTLKIQRTYQNAVSLVSELIAFSVLHQFCSWLIGDYIELHNVEMDHDGSCEQDIFIDYFGALPVKLTKSGSGNKLRFNAAHLERRVVRTYSELEMLLKVFPLDVIPADFKRSHFASCVKRIFYDAIIRHSQLPRIPELARSLNVSCATLCRRLSEEQTSVRAIKDSCRLELAREYLLSSSMSIDEISDRLGFSDATNFRRAFRTWSGASASEFQKLHRHRSLGGSRGKSQSN